MLQNKNFFSLAQEIPDEHTRKTGLEAVSANDSTESLRTIRPRVRKKRRRDSHRAAFFGLCVGLSAPSFVLPRKKEESDDSLRKFEEPES